MFVQRGGAVADTQSIASDGERVELNPPADQIALRVFDGGS